MIKQSKISRPLLRYHGGKWLLAPWIISHFPSHKIYVEPFGGAGSVLLRKDRSRCEVWNDLDEEVVNLFRVLRDKNSARQLCDLLELTPFARTEFEKAYEPSDDPIERARRLVVRSFMGFGSSAGSRRNRTGFRAASKDSGRPHALDWTNLPESAWLVTERLKGVTIEHRDALEIIKQQDHLETLFYVDPPYLQTTRPNSSKRQYRFELGPQEHRALARLLHGVKGKVLLSGYASELYDNELYNDWRREEKISWANGQSGRVERLEVLWMNF